MMGVARRIYDRLPVCGQNLAVTAYGLYWYWLRFGSGFEEYCRDYRRREAFGMDEWRAWRRRRLKHLLADCARRVPYYQSHWTKAQKDAAVQGALHALPLLDKREIRNNATRFLREDLRPLLRRVYHTSGSTGTPIATYWTIPEIRNSIALREVRSNIWAGVSFKMPRATFSGRIVVPDPDSRGPYHRFNAIEKQVYLSAYHLSPETAGEYVRALMQYGVQWLTGYAVSFFLLAKFMLEQNLKAPRLKAVITTSEKVTDEMKTIMERAYHCKVYEEYSTVENAVFASACELGNLHISPDVAVIEIVRPDGTACDPGEIGEVVTTCFIRDYQPFIRYRLGDLGVMDPEPCACGRNMPVIQEVVGRMEDVIVGPDGRQLVRFHGIFVDQPNIIEGQIIQESPNRIKVRVVANNDFGPRDVDSIKSRIHVRLGKQVFVEVERTEEIPRSPAGKFQAVVSHVKR